MKFPTRYGSGLKEEPRFPIKECRSEGRFDFNQKTLKLFGRTYPASAKYTTRTAWEYGEVLLLILFMKITMAAFRCRALTPEWRIYISKKSFRVGISIIWTIKKGARPPSSVPVLETFYLSRARSLLVRTSPSLVSVFR